MKTIIRFQLNHQETEVMAEPTETLLHVLRETLHLTGTKEGCGVGECGACTVLLDEQAVNACLVPVMEAEGRRVLTIEDVEDREIEQLRAFFRQYHAIQCGFCTPGMILSAKALLLRNPHPSEEEVRTALSGNLCRCTGYTPIIRAVRACAEQTSGV